jgi:hypothetical protein
MIGFYWKRGNVEKEQDYIFKSNDPVAAELQGIDGWKLKSVFERIMRKPKEVKQAKKRGRPKNIKTNPLGF